MINIIMKNNLSTPLPYVYLCKHNKTGQFYIGYREKNVQLGLTSAEDLPIYRTSSKIVNPNFHEYSWTIVSEFENGNDAIDFEQKLIFENWGDPLLLNKSCRYKSKNRFKSKKGSDVSKETRDKIIAANTGRKRSEETKRKISQSQKGKIPWNKGKLRGPMSEEQKIKISLGGKGLKKSSETKQRMVAATYKKLKEGTHPSQQTIICPHCNKLVNGIGNAKRWHFDKCRDIL